MAWRPTPPTQTAHKSAVEEDVRESRRWWWAGRASRTPQAAQPCLAFVRVWRCGRCVLTRRHLREAEPLSCGQSCRKQSYTNSPAKRELNKARCYRKDASVRGSSKRSHDRVGYAPLASSARLEDGSRNTVQAHSPWNQSTWDVDRSKDTTQLPSHGPS